MMDVSRTVIREALGAAGLGFVLLSHLCFSLSNDELKLLP
jgi:hypothetical protein